MTKAEARDLILKALWAANVNYNQHQQDGRVRQLLRAAAEHQVISVEVVRGGYAGTPTKPRVVLGCTNSRRHGKRLYTVVANIAQ